jgi:SAM-dependent methyltransferase
MATIGQAQVNASLVCQMLGDHPLAPGARLLFVGCGTGQTLDFADLDELRGFTITFSDINPEFLAKLEERLRRDGLEALVVQDDLTSTQLAERFDAVSMSARYPTQRPWWDSSSSRKAIQAEPTRSSRWHRDAAVGDVGERQGFACPS